MPELRLEPVCLTHRQLARIALGKLIDRLPVPVTALLVTGILLLVGPALYVAISWLVEARSILLRHAPALVWAPPILCAFVIGFRLKDGTHRAAGSLFS